MRVPYTRYRPIRVSDQRGGYRQTLSDPVVIYGEIEVHDEDRRLTNVDGGEDIIVGDIVLIKEPSVG